jgi:hypothetical protein
LTTLVGRVPAVSIGVTCIERAVIGMGILTTLLTVSKISVLHGQFAAEFNKVAIAFEVSMVSAPSLLRLLAKEAVIPRVALVCNVVAPRLVAPMKMLGHAIIRFIPAGILKKC